MDGSSVQPVDRRHIVFAGRVLRGPDNTTFAGGYRLRGFGGFSPVVPACAEPRHVGRSNAAIASPHVAGAVPELSAELAHSVVVALSQTSSSSRSPSIRRYSS